MINKSFFIGVLLALPFYGSSQQTAVTDTSYANGYYVERVEYFSKLPVQKKPVIFLGNSITEVGNWQEVTAIPNVINRGISGDNSFGVFHRLDAIIALKPKKIFLLIGVNDIKRGTPLAIIANNYERIIKKVTKESPGTRLYLQSVLPVCEPMLASIYDNIRNNKIISLNVMLKELAEKHRLPYVDLYHNLFMDKNGQLIKTLSTDGLHLQPEAYILWAAYLKQQRYL